MRLLLCFKWALQVLLSALWIEILYLLCVGLLTAIHKDYLRVLNYRELLFNDFGDRVAQLFHVESVVPFLQNHKGKVGQESLIVNTHLLFPHDSILSLVRLRQVNTFSFRSLTNLFLISWFLYTSCGFTSHGISTLSSNRFTKYCNMWNHIREKKSSNPFPSYYVGEFLSCFAPPKLLMIVEGD